MNRWCALAAALRRRARIGGLDKGGRSTGAGAVAAASPPAARPGSRAIGSRRTASRSRCAGTCGAASAMPIWPNCSPSTACASIRNFQAGLNICAEGEGAAHVQRRGSAPDGGCVAVEHRCQVVDRSPFRRPLRNVPPLAPLGRCGAAHPPSHPIRQRLGRRQAVNNRLPRGRPVPPSDEGKPCLSSELRSELRAR